MMTADRAFSKRRPPRNLAGGLAGALALTLALTGCGLLAPSRPGPSAKLTSYAQDAARVSEENRDYGAAVAHYTTLYESNRTDPRIVLGLARNLRYVGRADGALKVLEEARARLGEQAPLLAEQGKAQIAAGRAEPALAPLRRAAELDPGDWQVADALGIACDRLGRFDEAAEHYRRALALSPDNPVVLNNLGLSRAAAGDLDEGLRLARQAAARAPERAQLRENVALLESLRGGTGAAVSSAGSTSRRRAPRSARGR